MNISQRPQLNFAAHAERAKGMTLAALWFSRRDAYQAGLMAWSNEQAGGLALGAKDQGYYMDECSVFAAEITRRRKA